MVSKLNSNRMKKLLLAFSMVMFCFVAAQAQQTRPKIKQFQLAPGERYMILTDGSGTQYYTPFDDAVDTINSDTRLDDPRISGDTLYFTVIDKDGNPIDTQFVNLDLFIEVERNAGAPGSTPAGNDPIIYVNESNGDLYTWDGSQWRLIGAGDHDWYEVGTTDPPNNINDNIYTHGMLGVNKESLYDTVDIRGTFHAQHSPGGQVYFGSRVQGFMNWKPFVEPFTAQPQSANGPGIYQQYNNDTLAAWVGTRSGAEGYEAAMYSGNKTDSTFALFTLSYGGVNLHTRNSVARDRIVSGDQSLFEISRSNRPITRKAGLYMHQDGFFQLKQVHYGDTTDVIYSDSTGDVYFDKYPASRTDTATATPSNFLYTDSEGKLQSADLEYIDRELVNAGVPVSTYTAAEAGETIVNFNNKVKHIAEINCASVTSEFSMTVENAWDGVTTAAVYNVRFHSVPGSTITVTLDAGKTFYSEIGQAITELVLVANEDKILTMYVKDGVTFYTME